MMAAMAARLDSCCLRTRDCWGIVSDSGYSAEINSGKNQLWVLPYLIPYPKEYVNSAPWCTHLTRYEKTILKAKTHKQRDKMARAQTINVGRD